MDDAIRPIEGASVVVTAPGVTLNGTSDNEGRFGFTGLDSGTYIVDVSKPFYSSHQRAVVVLAGVEEPEITRFQLVFEASSVPYATVYKYEGFHECGFNFIRVCSNINIATWIVLCTYGVCPGNVTTDRSLFFQVIEGIPTYLQAELVWEPTSETGRAMRLLIGGGNETELQTGLATAYNQTSGESPLMTRLTNHEGETAWCNRPAADPPCGQEALNNSRIGTERALMGQVDAGPTQWAPGLSAGFSVQQPFTMFTTVFYGYEPPPDWTFASGAPVPLAPPG